MSPLKDQVRNASAATFWYQVVLMQDWMSTEKDVCRLRKNNLLCPLLSMSPLMSQSTALFCFTPRYLWGIECPQTNFYFLKWENKTVKCMGCLSLSGLHSEDETSGFVVKLLWRYTPKLETRFMQWQCGQKWSQFLPQSRGHHCCFICFTWPTIWL